VRRSRAGAVRNSCPAGLRCRTGGDARILGNEKPVVPVSLAAPFRPTQQRAGAPSGAPGLLLCQEAGVSPLRSWSSSIPVVCAGLARRSQPRPESGGHHERTARPGVELGHHDFRARVISRRNQSKSLHLRGFWSADLGLDKFANCGVSSPIWVPGSSSVPKWTLPGRGNWPEGGWLISSDVGRGMHCGPQAWGFAGSVVRRASARARCGSGARSAPGAPSAVPCLACPLAVDHVDDSPVLHLLGLGSLMGALVDLHLPAAELGPGGLSRASSPKSGA
jgi:hypothetical protein